MSTQRVATAGWLHDDAEEDLVGADWHQDAIQGLVFSLRDLAEELQLPWHVGNQLRLVATKPDGSSWWPMPDVMLHPLAGPEPRTEMSVGEDGFPVLIIEVASPTTYEYDVDIQDGKAWGYLQLGVPNYLVFDPYGELLGEQCRGWQLHGRAIREWKPDGDGRYHPIGLSTSFRPEGRLLRVVDPEGGPVAFPFETSRLLREQEQELAHLRAELERLRAERDRG